MRLTKFALLCTFLSSVSSLQAHPWNINPFIGADVSWRHLPFQEGYGEGFFQDNYYAPMILAGFRFLDIFALEAGWGKSGKREKNTFYSADQMVLGFDLLNTFNENQIQLASSDYDNWRVTLSGDYFLNDAFSIFIAGGVSMIRLSFHTQPIGEFTNFTNPVVEWNTKRKAVGRFGLGARYFLTSNISLQGSAFWENTSSLTKSTPADEALFPPTSISDYYTVKAKNSGLLEFSIVYQLCPQNTCNWL